MTLTRRTLIKAAPVIAAPVAVGFELSGVRSIPDKVLPLVLFESRNMISERFSAALPTSLKRFEVHDRGALQYHEIADVLADTSIFLLGLTGSATFLMLQRLAVDAGRRFVLTASHLPCCEGGNVHIARAGLASSATRDLSDHDGWVETLAESYLAMSLLNSSVMRSDQREPSSLPGSLSQSAYSWVLR